METPMLCITEPLVGIILAQGDTYGKRFPCYYVLIYMKYENVHAITVTPPTAFLYIYTHLFSNEGHINKQ